MAALYTVIWFRGLDSSWSPPSVCEQLLSRECISDFQFAPKQSRAEKCYAISVGRSY